MAAHGDAGGAGRRAICRSTSWKSRSPATGRLLLCSDGLHGLVNDAELAAALAKSRDKLDGLCSSLIQTANDRGAPDNVSVLVVDW